MVLEIIVSVILLAVGIAILIIIHVCVVGRAFRDQHFGGDDSNPVRPAGRVPGLKPDDIKALPVFEYVSDGNGPGNSVECAVCLDNFMGGEKCRALPKCNHLFHGDCIDSWLKKTGACPVCRTAAKTMQLDEQDCSSFSGEAGLELV